MINKPEVVVTLLDGTTREFNSWDDYRDVRNSLVLHSHNDQPAYVCYYKDGTIAVKEWCNQGKWHRDNDQPAFIRYYKDGAIRFQVWYNQDTRHRDNGKPAVLQYHPDGTVEFQTWHKEGKKITEQQAKQSCSQQSPQVTNNCTCDITDLMKHGCTCGGV